MLDASITSSEMFTHTFKGSSVVREDVVVAIYAYCVEVWAEEDGQLALIKTCETGTEASKFIQKHYRKAPVSVYALGGA